MNNYKFTLEISLKAHSDESAYAALIEQMRPMLGFCMQTVGVEVNGRKMSEDRFDKVCEEVLANID